ncbi:MAG: adenosylcobinamide-phosphate synthase CbiB [Cellvibrionaceae bacterium]
MTGVAPLDWQALFQNHFVMSALVCGLALLLDRVFGEPRRLHPLVAFGNWVVFVERSVIGYGKKRSAGFVLFLGVFAWIVAVAVPGVLLLLAYWQLSLVLPAMLLLVVDTLVLYLVIGGKSLGDHGMAVAKPLLDGDLPQARVKLGFIVSRETSNLNEEQVTTATVESILENAHDAVIAPLFWFVLLGLPGAVLWRMANTLDAMWGYRSPKYLYFGRFAARVDDALGFLSARVTVLLFGFLNMRAWSVVWHHGGQWWGTALSPNGLPVMAAGAGALNISLGGDAVYGGEKKHRPQLGLGRKPEASDIVKAIALVNRSYWVFVAVVLLLAALVSANI